MLLYFRFKIGITITFIQLHKFGLFIKRNALLKMGVYVLESVATHLKQCKDQILNINLTMY